MIIGRIIDNLKNEVDIKTCKFDKIEIKNSQTLLSFLYLVKFNNIWMINFFQYGDLSLQTL